METYLRYSDGGTSFLNKETMTIVDVRLSRIALRKKVTKPICNDNQSTSNIMIFNGCKEKPMIINKFNIKNIIKNSQVNNSSEKVGKNVKALIQQYRENS